MASSSFALSRPPNPPPLSPELHTARPHLNLIFRFHSFSNLPRLRSSRRISHFSQVLSFSLSVCVFKWNSWLGFGFWFRRVIIWWMILEIGLVIAALLLESMGMTRTRTMKMMRRRRIGVWIFWLGLFRMCSRRSLRGPGRPYGLFFPFQSLPNWFVPVILRFVICWRRALNLNWRIFSKYC